MAQNKRDDIPMEEPQWQGFYDTLNSQRREIRLIQIEPLKADQDEPATINITLTTHSLLEEPKYTALSYEWGSRSEMSEVSVFVNEQPAECRENLVLALQQMRKAGIGGYVWNDAICINQGDVEEREHQVSIMGEIYSAASDLYVWLGPARDSSEFAFKMLKHFVTTNSTPVHFGQAADIEGAKNAIMFWGRVGTPELRKTMWQAIVKILERSYWDRAWIIQEILLGPAERCTLACGSDSCSFVDLISFCTALKQIDRNAIPNEGEEQLPLFYLSNAVDRFAYFFKFHESRHLYPNNDPRTANIFELLLQFAHQNAKWPQDKVFSMLGIAKPFENSEIVIKVDYRSSYLDVYLNAAVSIVKGTRSFCIFQQSSRRPVNAEDLPSWVPDWTRNRTQPSIDSAPRNYSAGGTNYEFAEFNSDFKVLHTRGHVVCKISELFKCKWDIKTYPMQAVLKDLIKFLGKRFDPLEPQSVEGTLVIESLYHLVTKSFFPEGEAEKSWPIKQFYDFYNELLRGTHLPRVAMFRFVDIARLITSRTFFHCDFNNPGGLSWEDYTGHESFLKVLGVAGEKTEVGDLVVAIPGSQDLVVLRSTGESQHYTMIGLAYIDRYANGEALMEFAAEDIFIH